MDSSTGRCFDRPSSGAETNDAIVRPYLKFNIHCKSYRLHPVNEGAKPPAAEVLSGTGERKNRLRARHEPDPDEFDRYRAPALDKGLDILELLAGEEEGLSQRRSPRRSAAHRTNNIACSSGWCGAAMSPATPATVRADAQAVRPRPSPPADPTAGVQATPSCGRLPPAQCSRKTISRCTIASGVTVIAQMDAPGYWGLAIRVGARVACSTPGRATFCSPSARGSPRHDDRRAGGRRGGASGAGRPGGAPGQIRQRGYENAQMRPANGRCPDLLGARARRRRRGARSAHVSVLAPSTSQRPRNRGNHFDVARDGLGAVAGDPGEVDAEPVSAGV